MSNQRKVVLVSNKYPLPADDGKKVVLSGLIRYFSDRLGHDNTTLVCIGKQDVDEVDRLPCQIMWVEKVGTMRLLYNAAVKFAIQGTMSLQESIAFSPALQARLRSLISKIQPDLLILDTIRLGQFFRDPLSDGLRTVLYMDDLFNVRYRNMLAALDRYPDITIRPVGTLRHLLPEFAGRLLWPRWLQSALFRREARLLEHIEPRYALEFPTCLLPEQR